MNGEVTANLTAMPMGNLIVLIAGVLLLMIVGAVLIKHFNLNISKGSIKVSDYEVDQKCQTTMYHMQDTIDNIDFETRGAIRRQTKVSNYKIAGIGKVSEMCNSSRRSLYHSFKEPFYDFINANHFTREFRPDNIDSYKANLFECIHEIHQELTFEYHLDDCDRNEMDIWNEVAPQFEKLVDDWLLMAFKEVKKACNRKIKVYEQLIPEMEKSKHWSAVLNECITKNKEYIKNQDELINRFEGGRNGR